MAYFDLLSRPAVVQKATSAIYGTTPIELLIALVFALIDISLNLQKPLGFAVPALTKLRDIEGHFRTVSVAITVCYSCTLSCPMFTSSDVL